MKKNKSIKKIKKVMYKSRTSYFKTLVSLILVGGILVSVAYFFKYAYTQYAVSTAHVVLSYPEIAQSRYPDGSRFAYYDFVSDERLEEALEIMQNEGKYENLTVEDIKDKFFVYSYLDDSASAAVSSERSAGNDFSYVANEYKITFVQPHDYKNSQLLKKIFTLDYSDDFLRALVEVNRQYFAENKGGVDGFKALTDVDNNITNYDYDEQVKVYKTKIDAIIEHLKDLEEIAPRFKSEEHNLTIKDVRGKYEILASNKLDGIANFVSSSGITKNSEVTSNKIKVNIETNQVKLSKYYDRVQINNFAMANYDHTFTENLINVVRDQTQGLYQARPKTSFDTVVTQKNSAQEYVAEYQEAINILNRDLAKFNNASQDPAEHERLSKKSQTLLENFDKEYSELTETAREVVSEYLNGTNKDFVTAEIKQKSVFSIGLLTKLCIVFVVGGMFMFILSVFASVMSDARTLRRKLKMVEEIKQDSSEKGV